MSREDGSFKVYSMLLVWACVACKFSGGLLSEVVEVHYHQFFLEQSQQFYSRLFINELVSIAIKRIRFKLSK